MRSRRRRRRANVVPIRADMERMADHALTQQERNAFEEIAAALRERGGRRRAAQTRRLPEASPRAARRRRRFDDARADAAQNRSSRRGEADGG